MTINLLNTLPNSFLPMEGAELNLKGLSQAEAVEILKKEGYTSYVGHESFARLLSEKTQISIVHNRVSCPPTSRETPTMVAVVTPPRRLPEGEFWSPQEILTMPVKWVLVELV